MKAKPGRCATLTELAEATGFSRAAVSYALRDDPKIKEATRRLIQAEGARLGYRADPLVGVVMARVRAAHPPAQGGALAGLTWWRATADELSAEANGLFWRGASERAERLGWRLDEIAVDRGRLSERRVRQILRARGLRGVLVGPTPLAASFGLELDGLAAAAWGYTPKGRALHRACLHHGHGMALAFARARAAGFRRVGLVIAAHQAERTDRAWETSYAVQQEGQRGRLRPWVVEGRPDGRGMREWLEAQRPDVVLTTLPLRSALRAAGGRWERLPLVDLDRWPGGPERAGLDQQHAAVGAATVDLIVAQLHANETGEPERPKLVLIEGGWVDGPWEGPA